MLFSILITVHVCKSWNAINSCLLELHSMDTLHDAAVEHFFMNRSASKLYELCNSFSRLTWVKPKGVLLMLSFSTQDINLKKTSFATTLPVDLDSTVAGRFVYVLEFPLPGEGQFKVQTNKTVNGQIHCKGYFSVCFSLSIRMWMINDAISQG